MFILSDESVDIVGYFLQYGACTKNITIIQFAAKHFSAIPLGLFMNIFG